MTFQRFLSLMFRPFPVFVILVLCAARGLDWTRARLFRSEHAAPRPPREVHRRRGSWYWRTAA